MHACTVDKICDCARQVLGLTVLAWGNSVGDMSTNCAMARKGLANMAMTACYAGPVFNLLVRIRTFMHACMHAVEVHAWMHAWKSVQCSPSAGHRKKHDWHLGT